MATNELQTNRGEYGIIDWLFFVLWILTAYFTRNLMCQAMMMLFVAVVAYVMMMRPLKVKGTFYFWGNILFILYGYIMIKTGNAVNDGVAMKMVKSLSLNLVMSYAIVQYIVWKNELRSLMMLFEWGIFIVSLMVIISSVDTLSEGRLGGGTVVNSNMLAMLAVYGMVLCMYLINDAVNPGFYRLKILFFIAVVLFTGSRKGIIMILLAIMIINFVQGHKKIVKNIIIISFLAVALYVLVMNVKVLYDIIGVRIENMLELIFTDETSDGSLITRQLLIDIGKDYIRDNPWIGYGYDCFKVVSDVNVVGDAYGAYAHNNYIELLFSGGIIGTVLYYIPVVEILIRLIRHIKTDRCITYLLAILVPKLAVEYAYVSYYSRVDTYITAVIVGAVLFCNNKQKEIKAAEENENAVDKKTLKKPI